MLISFYQFRFPKEDIRRNKWVANIGRENWTPNYKCSAHFTADSFKRSGQHVFLLKTAIPTLFSTDQVCNNKERKLNISYHLSHEISVRELWTIHLKLLFSNWVSNARSVNGRLSFAKNIPLCQIKTKTKYRQFSLVCRYVLSITTILFHFCPP